MMHTRPLRSVLFVPGNRTRMLDKARSLPADAVILDLEDGVPPADKAAARTVVRQALEAGTFEPLVVLRVNAFVTGLVEADLAAAFVAGVDAVCLPKAEMPGDVERLEALLAAWEGQAGRPAGPVGLLLMIETALGAINAYSLARAGRRVRGLCLGGEDLARDLGAVRTKVGREIELVRAQMVLAARAAGAVAIDTIYTDLTDPDGLRAEARLARQMGYSGKLVIHPAQIEPVHQAFAPGPDEVAYARRLLAEFEAASAHGQGVIAVDGQMIDAPVVARAREILAMASVRT